MARRLFLKQGNPEQGGDQKSEIRLQAVNQFAAEMDHFSECVLNNQPPRTPGEIGLADMRIVAAIHEAARTSKVVRIGR